VKAAFRRAFTEKVKMERMDTLLLIQTLATPSKSKYYRHWGTTRSRTLKDHTE